MVRLTRDARIAAGRGIALTRPTTLGYKKVARCLARAEGVVAKLLSILPERCTACRACELACSLKHTATLNPSRSRIKVTLFPEEAVYIPTACTQCSGAWCVKICPTNAIVRDDRHMAYVVDNSRCVGCKMCVLACPFGAMELNPDHGKAEKCDLCLSIDGDPACVKFCAPGALLFTEEDAGTRAKRLATARGLKELAA
jgi:Fe-S-cluster-containing hydrogenase component 2